MSLGANQKREFIENKEFTVYSLWKAYTCDSFYTTMVVILLVYTFSLIRAFFVVCKTFKLNYIRKKDHLLPVGPGIWF